MRWPSRVVLQAKLAEHTSGRLARLFKPAPDEPWRASVLDYFKQVDVLDRECREALRVYGRTKRPARAIFDRMGVPISFEIDVLARLPPTARVLLLALINGKTKIGPVLIESKRTRTTVEWLSPAFTTRGFVVTVFEFCQVVDSSPPPEMQWGPPRTPERRQLTDLQLAWIHAYVFQQETMGAVPPGDLDRTEAQYLESERRRIRKAREHYAEEIGSVSGSTRHGERLLLPRFT